MLTEMELNTRSYQPNFPLDVVWAVLDCVKQECNCLLTVSLALVRLSCLDVDLPVELSGHVLEDLIENCLDAVKSLQSCLFWNFLIQSEILEPKWSVFRNRIETLFAVLQCLL